MQVREELRKKMQVLIDRLPNTLTGMLQIDHTFVDYDKVVATMPVGPTSWQPFGLLHGGASVALAESLASIGAWLNVDESKFAVVGMEINANHVRALRDGVVTGTAIPLHKGRRTHVWEVRICSADQKLVCISRCTLAIVPLAEMG